MKIGLIGLPMTGKTTIFNLLTNAVGDEASIASGRTEANIGVAKIPDKRIDFLAGIYKPKKIVYATIEATDIKGFAGGSKAMGSGVNPFLEAVRQVDALVHVVRAFKTEDVVHVEGTVDPLRDIETVNLELLFSDLSVIENRINRIETAKKITKEMTEELEVLKKCRDCLEKEKLINTLDLTDEERQHLKSFQFLTERPLVLVINLDEDQFRTGAYQDKEKITEYAKGKNITLVEMCARTEFEIAQLEEEDRKMFMEDLGITETGISRLAEAMYSYLGLISFLTVGEDEVRAWPVKKGIKAKEAGGKIHSDIERGFIRAEVVKYTDFETLGSMQKIKEKGLFRLEGKEYLIEDGDIINFRFNV